MLLIDQCFAQEKQSGKQNQEFTCSAELNAFSPLHGHFQLLYYTAVGQTAPTCSPRGALHWFVINTSSGHSKYDMSNSYPMTQYGQLFPISNQSVLSLQCYFILLNLHHNSFPKPNLTKIGFVPKPTILTYCVNEEVE